MTLFGTFFEENRRDLQRKSVKIGNRGFCERGQPKTEN